MIVVHSDSLIKMSRTMKIFDKVKEKKTCLLLEKSEAFATIFRFNQKVCDVDFRVDCDRDKECRK